MTIIDWMNQLLVHKKHWNDFTEDEQKKFSPFIINRWLSMDKDFLEIVNFFQKYSIGTLEPREVYKWYCDVLPKGKRFNKYIKGKRDKKYNTELLIIKIAKTTILKPDTNIIVSHDDISNKVCPRSG